MYITAFEKMDARFAAAACRAYNDWLHDYIEAADPKRLFGAAAVSAHDVTSAVAETRRAVGNSGLHEASCLHCAPHAQTFVARQLTTGPERSIPSSG